MELADSKYNKMDRERGKNGVSRQREGREEAVCQGRRAALFPLPSTTQGLIQRRGRSRERPCGSKLSGFTWK